MTNLRDTHWADRSACIKLEPAMFYPNPRRPGYQAAVTRAKTVCFGCPVWRECLNYAMDQQIEEGVWGGLAADERTTAWQRARSTRLNPSWDYCGQVEHVEGGVLVGEVAASTSGPHRSGRPTSPGRPTHPRG